MATVTPEVDPFLDEKFAPLQLDRPDGLDLEALPEGEEEELVIAGPPTADPQQFAADPEEEPEPAPAPAPAAEPEPEVLQTKLGTVTIQHTKKGWQGTLQLHDGSNPEVFYGGTKDQLLLNIATSKMEATKTIRRQNREIKLGSTPTAAPAKPAIQPNVRALTADEEFEIRTELQNAPTKALDSYFQKRTGMSVEQLVALAVEGREANMRVIIKDVATDFKNENPEYYPDAENQNVTALVGYLFKHKLHKVYSPQSGDDPLTELCLAGAWTVPNLTEAYEELNEAGLLLPLPKAPVKAKPAAPKAPTAPAPAPTPQDDRIVRTVRRPRAAIGLRPTQDTVPAPAARPQNAPSVDEMEAMDDKQINELMSAVGRHAATRRR